MTTVLVVVETLEDSSKYAGLLKVARAEAPHRACPGSLVVARLTGQGAYSYFRTGVHVEGHAWLCDDPHVPVIVIGDTVLGHDPVPQHIDVRLRFWNRRGGRVTLIELTEMEGAPAGARVPASRPGLIEAARRGDDGRPALCPGRPTASKEAG